MQVGANDITVARTFGLVGAIVACPARYDTEGRHAVPKGC